MTRFVARLSVAVAASTALGALGVAGVSAAGAATQVRQQVRAPSAAAVHALSGPGARLWSRRYNGPANGGDIAKSVVVSPGGGRVFVTGTSHGAATGDDYLTIAYTAAGTRLWVARYDGPVNGADVARAIAVSPDGTTVFVTGESAGQPTDGTNAPDYATVAYRASDGKELWVARYNGPGHWADSARAVSVARDGTAVFVTGESAPTYSDIRNYATVAYRAATGARLWVSRYAGPEGEDSANAVLSPGANRVFVTGYSRGGNEAEYATVAYNATTGAQLWVRRYSGPGLFFNVATSVAASPDLRKVYVTGRDGGYATVAYSASTGAQLWVRRYTGPSTGRDDSNAVTVSPGGTVLVTGTSASVHAGRDYATIAYSATGARLWVARYNGPGNGADDASSVVAPGNLTVIVTGTSWGGSSMRNDYATIAYSVVTGARLWVQRYNGPASGGDFANSLAAGSGRVFVSGASQGTTTGQDYATIVYNS